MSKSPERYCLGGLMKDIEKELSIDDLDNSNEGTSYKSSQEKRFFSNDTYFPQFSTFFSPSLENINLFSKSKGSEPEKEEKKNKCIPNLVKNIFWNALIVKKKQSNYKKV